MLGRAVRGLIVLLLCGTGCAAPRPIAASERQAWLNCTQIILWNCGGDGACEAAHAHRFADAEDRLGWLENSRCPEGVLVGRVNARDYVATHPVIFHGPLAPRRAGQTQTYRPPARCEGTVTELGQSCPPFERACGMQCILCDDACTLEIARMPPYRPPPADMSTPGEDSSGGPVHVRGYYRSSGTYVAPHTRSSPRR